MIQIFSIRWVRDRRHWLGQITVVILRRRNVTRSTNIILPAPLPVGNYYNANIRVNYTAVDGRPPKSDYAVFSFLRSPPRESPENSSSLRSSPCSRRRANSSDQFVPGIATKIRVLKMTDKIHFKLIPAKVAESIIVEIRSEADLKETDLRCVVEASNLKPNETISVSFRSCLVNKATGGEILSCGVYSRFKMTSSAQEEKSVRDRYTAAPAMDCSDVALNVYSGDAEVKPAWMEYVLLPEQNHNAWLYLSVFVFKSAIYLGVLFVFESLYRGRLRYSREVTTLVMMCIFAQPARLVWGSVFA